MNQHLRQSMEHRCRQMDSRILSWGLASPALRALLSLNINTVEDLLSYSPKEVAKAHGMGNTGLQRIKEGLQQLGLDWG
ncbi:MAG: hypothetical protein FJ333_07515 [Sphingomonadales bacterium]|nr:hypothetical protein [Sphingomonadales bacterium]